MRHIFAWFALVLLTVACCPAQPVTVAPVSDARPRGAVVEESTAGVTVVRVIDGDTIEVEGGERVRLLCIDTPERGAPGFTEAGDFVRDRIEGKRVRLEADPEMKDRDGFGRLLRYVFLDSLNLNVEMVRQGFTDYATKWGASSLYDAEFVEAQQGR